MKNKCVCLAGVVLAALLVLGICPVQSGMAGRLLPGPEVILAADVKTSGNWEYTVNGKEVTITKYNGTAKSVKVPKKLGGKKVTVIGEGAFEESHFEENRIEKVILQKGIKEIGKNAFLRCKSLKSISLPSGLKIIGESAFSQCSVLKLKKLPSSVRTLGPWAFDACEMIELKTIPAGIKEIPDYCFHNCGGVLWESGAYSAKILGWTGMTSFVVPEGVTRIGRCAFEDCDNLKSITIPSTVKSIGAYALGTYSSEVYCGSLKTVTIKSKKLKDSTVDDYVFRGGSMAEFLPSTVTIYVPKSKLSAYKKIFKKKGFKGKIKAIS